MSNRDSLDDISTKFLLAEHRYISQSYWHNREAGEKRVSLFLTLVAALISALIVLTGAYLDAQISDAR